MNETPSSSISENIVFLKEVCNRVQKLYPDTEEIQSFIGKDKRVSLWVINKNTIEKELFGVIQQSIMAEFAKKNIGLKCSVNSIMQVTGGDIASQSDMGKQYLRTINTQVETDFLRDQIHVVFENGVFVVYGASPYDKNGIRGAIESYIPHTMPCCIHFKSSLDWERKGVGEAARKTREAFDSTDIPRLGSVRPGFLLRLLPQSVGKKIGR